MVADTADQRLDPAVRIEIARLLEGETDPTLAGISNWADEVRDSAIFRWTAPLHYVNFKDAGCSYSAERSCPDGLCVVGAIERYGAVLADRGRSDASRREALKFLVHFLGDVHQPLHAGYRNDRGGNRFQVSIDGQGSNLHAVWDSRLVQSREPADRDRARHAPPALQSSPLQTMAPTWASESCRLTDTDGLYPQRPGRLPDGYIERFRSLASERISLAGHRLAATLNRLLTNSPGPGG